jgi:hypothetical protein
MYLRNNYYLRIYEGYIVRATFEGTKVILAEGFKYIYIRSAKPTILS